DQAPVSEREARPHHHDARQRYEPRDRLTDDPERFAGVQETDPAARLPAGRLAVERLPRRDGAGRRVEHERMAALRLTAVAEIDREARGTIGRDRPIHLDALPAVEVLRRDREQRV